MSALAKLCPPGVLKSLLLEAKTVSMSFDAVLGSSKGLHKALSEHASASSKGTSAVPK